MTHAPPALSPGSVWSMPYLPSHRALCGRYPTYHLTGLCVADALPTISPGSVWPIPCPPSHPALWADALPTISPGSVWPMPYLPSPRALCGRYPTYSLTGLCGRCPTCPLAELCMLKLYIHCNRQFLACFIAERIANSVTTSRECV